MCYVGGFKLFVVEVFWDRFFNGGVFVELDVKEFWVLVGLVYGYGVEGSVCIVVYDVV